MQYLEDFNPNESLFTTSLKKEKQFEWTENFDIMLKQHSLFDASYDSDYDETKDNCGAVSQKSKFSGRWNRAICTALSEVLRQMR